MNDGPTTQNLLATALSVLREDILPGVAPEQKHEVLMIANAMAIAGRQIALAPEMDRRELKNLLNLLIESNSGNNINDLNKLLIGEIMKLAFDLPCPRRDKIYAHLVETTLGKLEISNPKYLKSTSA